MKDKNNQLEDKPKWVLVVEKYLFGSWVLVPFLICGILSIYLIHRITEYYLICWSRGSDVWDRGVRLIYSTHRELTDGSLLTIPEYLIRMMAIILLSFFAFAFWTYFWAYLNKWLFSKKLRNNSNGT